MQLFQLQLVVVFMIALILDNSLLYSLHTLINITKSFNFIIKAHTHKIEGSKKKKNSQSIIVCSQEPPANKPTRRRIEGRHRTDRQSSSRAKEEKKKQKGK
jgi:hypothetical protein